MVEASGQRPDYERSDVDPRLLATLALGVAAFLIAAPYALRAIYPLARHEPLPPAANALPAPRLQIDPRADLRALRATEVSMLSSYGWVDQGSGIVHLPIGRALELTIARGLPGWPKP